MTHTACGAYPSFHYIAFGLLGIKSAINFLTARHGSLSLQFYPPPPPPTHTHTHTDTHVLGYVRMTVYKGSWLGCGVLTAIYRGIVMFDKCTIKKEWTIFSSFDSQLESS